MRCEAQSWLSVGAHAPSCTSSSRLRAASQPLRCQHVHNRRQLSCTVLYRKDVQSWLGEKSDKAAFPQPPPQLQPRPRPPLDGLTASLGRLVSPWMDFTPGVRYTVDRQEVNADQLQSLWLAAGLYCRPQPRAVSAVALALERSHTVVAAFDGTELVGCARTLWDGAFVSMLLDCAVHPDYRERGIEAALVRRAVRPGGSNRLTSDGKPRPPAFGCVPADEAVAAALAGQGFRPSTKHVFLTRRVDIE